MKFLLWAILILMASGVVLGLYIASIDSIYDGVYIAVYSGIISAACIVILRITKDD